MKISNKKLVFTLLGLSLIFTLTANAETPSSAETDVGGNISLIRCINKGGLDFSLFWDAVIYNDSFREGIIEPWKDIFNRNQCQTNDIIGLINQQDDIRSAIRNAFLTCDTEDLPRLKKRFHKITAEIYYVRHVIDSELALSLPYDVLTTRQISASLFRDRAVIFQEMRDKYVNGGILSAAELNSLFSELENKYAGRIGTLDEPGPYLVCSRGSWQEVSEKWKEFQRFFTEEYGGFKEAGQTLNARANELQKDFSKIKILDLIHGDISFKDYAASFVALSLNNMEAKEGFSEIKAAINKDLPTYSAPSQAEIFSGLSTTSAKYDIEKMKKEMSANYWVLYRDIGDSTIELFLNEIEKMDKTIVETYPDMNNILEGAKVMNFRQCPS